VQTPWLPLPLQTTSYAQLFSKRNVAPRQITVSVF
jgi:hypothetical protein